MIRGLQTLILIFVATPVWAFSVGTLNLWHYMDDYDNRVANLEKEIAQEGIPQILSLQEAARWGNQSIYDELIKRLGYKGFYQNTNEFAVMNEGLALDGGLPGKDFVSLELPATRMFSRQYMISGVFTTEIGDVAVVSTHFSPKGRDSRVEQAKFIVNHIQKFKIPVIVMGDINDLPDTKVLQVFKDAGFTDTLDWKEMTYVPGENPYNKSEGPERLDYILYRPTELKLVKSSLMFNKNVVSDHYGVKAEFTKVQKQSFVQDCPDLSGSYRGMCYEDREDGGKFQYDMQYEVVATECKALNIKVTTYPDQWSIQEKYDLEKGLIKAEDGDYTDVMSGGRYFDEGFLGTLLFVHVSGTVDTVLNEYRKSSDGKFLVTMTGFGSRMTCAMDPI